jgi:hypothetical protein
MKVGKRQEIGCLKVFPDSQTVLFGLTPIPDFGSESKREDSRQQDK